MRKIFYSCPTGWIPEEASSAHLFQIWQQGFEENLWFNILRRFILFAISVGLMKPQMGSTPAMGKEETEERQKMAG